MVLASDALRESTRAHDLPYSRGFGTCAEPPSLRWSSNAPQNHPHRRLGLANRRSPRSYHLQSFERASNALQILLPSGAPAQWNGLGRPMRVVRNCTSLRCQGVAPCVSLYRRILMAEYTGNWLWPKEKSWKRTDFPAFCSGWVLESGSECCSRRSRVRKQIGRASCRERV